MGKQTYFLAPPLLPLGNGCIYVFLKKYKKIGFTPILNIQLFPTHTELELGVFGVVGKLVKDVIQLRWRIYEK
jgi:hypothetical protein